MADMDIWEFRARALMWLNHGCEMRHLYGDDGEMQCRNVMRHPGLTDFKRANWDAILLSVLTAINEDRMPHDGDEFHERLESARAAIAKAEGREDR